MIFIYLLTPALKVWTEIHLTEASLNTAQSLRDNYFVWFPQNKLQEFQGLWCGNYWGGARLGSQMEKGLVGLFWQAKKTKVFKDRNIKNEISFYKADLKVAPIKQDKKNISLTNMISCLFS